MIVIVVHKTLQKLSERGFLTEKGELAHQEHEKYKALFDFLTDMPNGYAAPLRRYKTRV